MTHLSQEQSVKVGGTHYKLSRFTLPLLQEFLRWALSQLPDPYSGLADKIKGFSPDMAKYMIDKAETRSMARHDINDPEIQTLLGSVAGTKKVLALLMRKYQPSLTEEQVSDIADQGIEEHGEDFFTMCFGAPKGTLPPTQPT